MKCKECMDIINEYADGELAPELRQQVAEHLASCCECREYYDFIKSVEVTDDDIDFPEDLHSNIMSFVRQNKVRKIPIYRKRFLGWVAAACIVLAVTSVTAPRLVNPLNKEEANKLSGDMLAAEPSKNLAPQTPDAPQASALNAPEGKGGAVHVFKGSLELSDKLKSFNYTEHDGELYFECNNEEEVKLLEKILLESGYELTEDISKNIQDIPESNKSIVIVIKK